MKKRPSFIAKAAPGPTPLAQPAVLEFQTDAIELEERRPPPLARVTLYGIILAAGCGVAWASLSRIEEVIVAPGKLVTSEPTLVLQPLETAVIRSIEVRSGDIVRRGQVLATLDPTFTEADADQLQQRIAVLNAQIARLEAEHSNTVYVPPEDADANAVTQGQLSAQRSAAYAARLRNFDARIAHAEAVSEAARAEEEILTERLAGLEEIDEMRASLFETGSGSRLAVLQARDGSFDLQASLSDARGEQSASAQMLLQTAAERENFIQDYRRAILEELVELRDRQTAAIEELKKVQLRQTMSTLFAPLDAAVLEVAQRSIGSVLQPAEPLITLVPLNVPLEAEVSVPAKDIGRLSNGAPVRLKLDAFPFQKHGTVDGHIMSISNDAFMPPAGEGNSVPFYRAQVALGSVQLRGLPSDLRLLPGMAVTAEFTTGERSIVSYFLYPLIRGLDESLREP